MNIQRKAAREDLIALLGQGFEAIFYAAFNTAFSHGVTFVLTHICAWVLDVPIEFPAAFPAAAILQLSLFVSNTQHKACFSSIWTYMTRDAPFEGLPGAEVANMITKALIVIVYLLSTLIFHNLRTIMSFFYRFSTLAALGLPALVALFIVLDWLIPDMGLRQLRVIYRWLKGAIFILGYGFYFVPFQMVHLVRKGGNIVTTRMNPYLQHISSRGFRPLYAYGSLDSSVKEIRLIRLGRKSPFTGINCRLVTVPLDKAPDYEAISYTWGSSSKDHRVYFDNKQLSTTRNVHKILHDRCSYARSRWLWIDAVCINQDDLPEKTKQVEIMGEIYRNAERVIVWLDNEEITPWEFTSATALLELINYNSLDIPTDLYAPPTRILGTQNQWSSLKVLLSHPYWYRVWIIQEVALAKKIHVLYSRRYISWDHLCRMVVLLNTSPINKILSTAHIAYGMNPSQTMLGAFQIARIGGIRLRTGSAQLHDFVECVSATQSCAATSPSDKVFALRNIAKWPDSARERRLLRVDYEADATVVFTRATQLVIRQAPYFMLMYAGSGWDGRTPMLPSWVLDFASLPRYMDERTIAGGRHNAGGHMSIEISDSSEGAKNRHAIMMKAILVSKIASVTSIKLPASAGEISTVNTWLESAASFIDEAGGMIGNQAFRYQNSSQTVKEAFWRTLIEDRFVLEQEAFPRYQKPAPADFGTYFLYFQRTLTTRGASPFPGTESLVEEAQRAVSLMLHNATSQFSRAFTRACGERRFAVTEDKLMGIVPPGTRTGDIVCVIPGFEKGMLIRQNPRETGMGLDKNKFELVGPCYFHGIMNGEVMRGSPAIRTVYVE